MFGSFNRNAWNWAYHTTGSPSTTPGVVVTPSSGSEGSWVALASSANIAQDVYGVFVHINAGNTTATQRDIIVDIGVDPAGGTSYVSVISDILCSQASAFLNGGLSFYFPLFIKAGSSVGARARANSTSTVRVDTIFYGRPSHPESVFVAQYSETIGVSGNAGTGFTPGNSGSEGSWVSLGTTTRTLWWWQLGVGIANGTTTALAYYIDLATGDASNKYMIIENHRIILPGTAEQTTNIRLPVGFWEVPAGGTLYVRGTCSGTAVTGFSAIAIGVGG